MLRCCCEWTSQCHSMLKSWMASSGDVPYVIDTIIHSNHGHLIVQEVRATLSDHICDSHIESSRDRHLLQELLSHKSKATSHCLLFFKKFTDLLFCHVVNKHKTNYQENIKGNPSQFMWFSTSGRILFKKWANALLNNPFSLFNFLEVVKMGLLLAE